MIAEFLMEGSTVILRFIFGLIDVFALPVDLVATLYSLVCYGTWVVGSDLMLICTGCITFWIGIRVSVGFAIWVYEHIPFV